MVLKNETVPLAVPPNVRVAAESSSSLRVTWSQQEAQIIEYVVSYRRTGEASHQLIKRKIDPSQTSCVVDGLRPDSSYIVVLTAFAEGGQVKSSQVITCKTYGNVPGVPNRLAFQVTSATSLHVSWGEPAVTNGKICGYEIKYHPCEDDPTSVESTSKLPPTVVKIPNGSYRSLMVDGLIENTTYLYSVRAENASGYGEWQRAKMRIDHKIGTRPPSTIFLDEKSIESFQKEQEEAGKLLKSSTSSTSSTSTSGKTITTKEEETVTTTRRIKPKSPPPPKTVTSHDVTTRITRHLRGKGGKPGEKEVKEYPGRLSREEIEKLTSGCERVEVNVMTRSMKKTVPGDSPLAAAATSSTSSPRHLSTQQRQIRGSGSGDKTTITKTVRTTSQQQQAQQQLQQEQRKTTKTTTTTSSRQQKQEKSSRQTRKK